MLVFCHFRPIGALAEYFCYFFALPGDFRFLLHSPLHRVLEMLAKFLLTEDANLINQGHVNHD